MQDKLLHRARESTPGTKLKHLFVAELLKHSCKRAHQEGVTLIEVSWADVDRGGYDLIAELGGCLRHIQIKGSVRGSTTARQ